MSAVPLGTRPEGASQLIREYIYLYGAVCLDRGVLPKQGETDLKGLVRVIVMMGEAAAIQLLLPAPEWSVDLQYLRAGGVQ
jgi:hypothetical protein